jgi:Fe-S-cluster containining protein
LTTNNKFLIPITKEDAKMLRKNPIFQDIEKNHKVGIKKATFDPFYPYELVAKGLCPFLDKKEKICVIYEDRPSGCRSFLCYEASGQ